MMHIYFSHRRRNFQDFCDLSWRKADQQTALGVQPVDKLQEAFTLKRLDSDTSNEVRKIFNRSILEGIVYFLENFTPYKKYISDIRALEKEFNAKSSSARHAFYDIRFGSNYGGESEQEDIREVRGDIIESIEEIVRDLSLLLQQDIGMRGVMCAFGRLRHYYARSLSSTPSNWLSYSKWFTKNMNKLIEDKWLNGLDQRKYKLLKHITYDHNDNRVNYRLDHARIALGPFIGLLVAAYGKKNSQDEWNQLRESYLEKIQDTLFRGYKKEMRVLLKDEYVNDLTELNAEVKKRAQKKAKEHIKKLEKAVESII